MLGLTKDGLDTTIIKKEKIVKLVEMHKKKGENSQIKMSLTTRRGHTLPPIVPLNIMLQVRFELGFSGQI